jgi:nucleotide-binding universal stress UspA family protein
MYKRLLVAVDGSESSLHALKEAFRLNCPIVAVSVAPAYEGDVPLVGVKNIRELMAGPCTKALALADAMAQETGAEVKTICARGDIHQTIVDLAVQEKCDLIVMGLKGMSALERVLIGSVTRKVIGFSATDVLVIPREGVVTRGKILLPTDGSSYSQGAAERALEMASANGSELLALSVVEMPLEVISAAPEYQAGLRARAQTCLDGVLTRAQALGIKAGGRVLEGEAHRVISQVAADWQADLIVMGSHGCTGLCRLLMGSVAERVVGQVPCPVLVVRREG